MGNRRSLGSPPVAGLISQSLIAQHLPEPANTVAVEQIVVAHQDEIVGERLSHEHAIERVAVVKGKLEKFRKMSARKREQVAGRPPLDFAQGLRPRIAQAQFAGRDFDGDLS